VTALPAPWLAVVVALVWIAIVAVGGGVLTEVGPWYENLNFPPWRPPNWLFAPAWTIIYLFVGASGVIAWYGAPDPSTRGWLVGLFLINGVLNILWSGLFFKLRRPDWALIEVAALWLSILILLVFIGSFSRPAAALMIPYLAWVSFAALLNLRMVQLNAPFDGKT
jgi:tryptophan-rich sensory protein